MWFSARIFLFKEFNLLIDIENLSFCYPDGLEDVFSGLNLQIDSGWKLGVVGGNGRGKTTFLKLLSGELKGRGRITANMNFVRFPCEISDESKTAYELFYEIAPEAELWRLQKEIGLLNLEEDILYRPFNTLSGGERTKFLLAAAFAQEAFPLIDEPTDHLDLIGRKYLAEYLNRKNGFIVISHDRAFLDGCCNRILAFEKTETRITRGNYSVYYTEREKRKAAEESKKEKLESERARLRRSAARAAVWGASAESAISNKNGRLSDSHAVIDRGFLSAKSAKTQKRAKVIAERYSRAEEGIKDLLKGYGEVEALRLQPQKFFRAQYAELRDICVRTDKKLLLNGFNLDISEGERIAVVGGNGRGKSTLLKLICGILGEQFKISGEIAVSPRLKISYVPQMCKTEGYIGAYAREYGMDEWYLKAILSKFGFAEKDFDRDMKVFSQGQKKKCALARSLCEKANMYIWDEPLNYLDISAREQIEQAVISSGATLLFVEHDAAFIKNVATRIIELK